MLRASGAPAIRLESAHRTPTSGNHGDTVKRRVVREMEELAQYRVPGCDYRASIYEQRAHKMVLHDKIRMRCL